MPDPAQNNNVLQKPHVVIALLDWGLGHTTRSIPILRHLIEINCNVLVACNSNQKTLLTEEFPNLRFEVLEGYNIRYAKNAWLTTLFIIFQIPKILTKIKRENKWLHQFLLQQPAHLIISDNRFGFHSPHVPSIFITHQLAINTGLGPLFNRLAQYLNYRSIKKFSRCWVPDFEAHPNLAGALSHPHKMPDPTVQYLGGLSRFKPCNYSTKQHSVLIVLSGPEPQRSLLEQKIVAEAATIPQNFVLVRGLPEHAPPLSAPHNIAVFNHLPARELQPLLCNAQMVISRAGYTSIMDYMKLGIRSILIPTPGQAEQQYLAKYLHESQLAFSVQQQEFSLEKALHSATAFPYQHPEFDMNQYRITISQYIDSLAADSKR